MQIKASHVLTGDKSKSISISGMTQEEYRLFDRLFNCFEAIPRWAKSQGNFTSAEVAGLGKLMKTIAMTIDP